MENLQRKTVNLIMASAVNIFLGKIYIGDTCILDATTALILIFLKKELKFNFDIKKII